MTLEELRAAGFNHVERDDRLLDVFSKETPEKGVELWEKWDTETITIVRIHNHRQSKHVFDRSRVEQALLAQQSLTL